MRARTRAVAAVATAVLATTGCTKEAAEAPGSGAALPSPSHVQAGESDRKPCRGFAELLANVKHGYYRFRSPDITLIPREPNYVGSAAMPVHSGPWDYLTHVPIVLYGPGHVAAVGDVQTRASVADMATTAADLVGLDEWPQRDGAVLREALGDGSGDPPRLIVSIVWDGGGWNVLEEHADSWPFLRRLMERGASYVNATIGSSPSVTPPIHTTLGTGAFPARHGIAGLRIRTRDYEYPNPFGRFDAHNLEIQTLADLYDKARGNEPVTGMLGSVNWHLGMIGHGSALPGADKDPVGLVDRTDGSINSNTDIYSRPDIADPGRLSELAVELDQQDGSRDEKWLGNPLTTFEEIHYTPAVAGYEEHLLERLVVAESFGADDVADLLYVNFKTSDVAGHRWGMTSEEVGAVIEGQDKALEDFIAFLDAEVGRGKWVVMLTADHGQNLYPNQTRAWPINGGEISRDLNARFDVTDDGVDLIDRTASAGTYVNLGALDDNHTTVRNMARWLGDYTLRENVKQGEPPAERYRKRLDELLFDGVVARDRLAVKSCR